MMRAAWPQGEVEVILDLVAAVEAQQAVAVAHCPRPLAPEEAAADRALRLAARRRQLAGAAARLDAGLAGLKAAAEVDAAFLAQLAALRARWRLRRHPGAGAVCGCWAAGAPPAAEWW